MAIGMYRTPSASMRSVAGTPKSTRPPASPPGPTTARFWHPRLPRSMDHQPRGPEKPRALSALLSVGTPSSDGEMYDYEHHSYRNIPRKHDVRHRRLANTRMVPPWVKKDIEDGRCLPSNEMVVEKAQLDGRYPLACGVGLAICMVGIQQQMIPFAFSFALLGGGVWQAFGLHLGCWIHG